MRSGKGRRVVETKLLVWEWTPREKSSCMSDGKEVELTAERLRFDIRSLKSCLMPFGGPAENGRPPTGSIGVRGVAFPELRDEDMPLIMS